MRNLILYSAIVIASLNEAVAQNNQVQNAFNYLKNKELDKAKASADAASINASTSNSAKLWMYRGKIYTAISDSKDPAVKNIDPNAQEKALESYITCLKFDKGNDNYKEEVKNLLLQSCYAVGLKAKALKDNKEYDKSIALVNLIEEAIPYDYDQLLKGNNITKETLLFGKYKTYLVAGNKELASQSVEKLIEMKYKDPYLYLDMSKLSLEAKDTAKALSYIERGRAIFGDNSELLTAEINIYLAQGKISILKDKLLKATELAPNNEVLQCVLANVYNSSKDQEKAIEHYKKSLAIKPMYEIANYNLGVIYFGRGKEWMDKVNALPLKEEAKAKDYEAKAKVEFKSATEYLEKSYEISPDKRTKQTLFQLFTRLGEPEKAAKYAKDKQ